MVGAAGVVSGVAVEPGAGGAPVAEPGLEILSMVSTSNATPVARRALVTASAGAEGSASGRRMVTR